MKSSALHSPPTRVAAALVLTSLSGAAGLMHQLIWVRRMVDVLGANAGTFSRVIAAFFLGLAAGAWLAARWPAARPWRAVAFAEAAVAALAAVVLFAGSSLLAPAQSEAIASLLEWLLPLLLITPPALAMGLVLPWLMRAIPPRFTVPIYGVNTLAGIAGLALSLGWALPILGLAGASLLALGLNLAAAVAALVIDRRTPRSHEAKSVHAPAPATGDAALAFLSGFLVLGSEVVFQHQFAQLLVSSHFSSGLVLALVLTALGAAALLTPLFARMGRHALLVALVCAAVACALQPLILVVQRGGLHYLPFEKPFAEYMLAALRLGLPACALPLLACGFVFPLLLRRSVSRGVDPGRLLAVNGLGGWLGAELTARTLSPIFGLWWSMTVLAAGYAIAVLLQPGRLRLVFFPALAIFLVATWRLDARLPYAGLSPGDTLTTVALGREGSVGVVRGAEPDDWRILFDNTYTLGGSRAAAHQERQTLLPMLLHGDARRVATLGIATGSSLAGATLDPALESAEGIELSPLVLRFARENFAAWNRGVLDDPRVRVTLADARLIMARRGGEFDVIAGDLFLPWRTGESRLFAREHFATVRRALRPGGLFCQWLPMYQLTRSQFETILRTFREVFPEAWLIRGDFHTSMPILGLVGGRALDTIEWEKVRAACDRTRQLGACRDPLLRHAEGVAMCVIGTPPPPVAGPENTLANSWLEWDAGRNVIGQREPWFIGIPAATYLREIHRVTTQLLPAGLQSAHQSGLWFHTLEIARASAHPQAANLTAQASSHLPDPLRADFAAEWKTWPMRYRPALP